MAIIYKLCTCLLSNRSKTTNHTMYHFTELDSEGVCKFCGYYGVQWDEKNYAEFLKLKAGGRKSSFKINIEDYKNLLRR